MSEEIKNEKNQREKIRVEAFTVNADEVMAKTKNLLHEGNVRRITLKNQSGKTLVELPLTLGLAGAVVGIIAAPVLVTIALLAAVVAKLHITVERVEDV